MSNLFPAVLSREEGVKALMSLPLGNNFCVKFLVDKRNICTVLFVVYETFGHFLRKILRNSFMRFVAKIARYSLIFEICNWKIR